MSDDGERTCPLCAEEMDLTDQQLKPCKCGYEICIWCWHHMIEMAEKEDTEARCPACRTPYDKDRVLKVAAANSERIISEMYSEKKQRSQRAKPKLSAETMKHLSSVRVMQKNLVYITGLPANFCDESILERKEYFGQYGKVLKVSISRPAGTSSQKTSNNNTFGVYVTYAREEEAVRCIQAVHNFVLDGKSLRACFGTTKYCRAWLKNMTCSNPDCLYLHDIGSQEDSFTKDEIVSAYARSRVSQIASSNSQRRSGNVLPSPLDDFYSSGTGLDKHSVENACNNASSQVKGSPPNTISGKPNGLPAAASWGLRSSNCQLSASSVQFFQTAAKQKLDTINNSSLPSLSVATSKQPSGQHDELLTTSKVPESKEAIGAITRPLEPLQLGTSADSPLTLSSETVLDGNCTLRSSWNDDVSVTSKPQEETKMEGLDDRSGQLEPPRPEIGGPQKIFSSELSTQIVDITDTYQVYSSCSSSPLDTTLEDKERGIISNGRQFSKSNCDRVTYDATIFNDDVQSLGSRFSSVNTDEHSTENQMNVNQHQTSVSDIWSAEMPRSQNLNSDPVTYSTNEPMDRNSEIQKQQLIYVMNGMEDPLAFQHNHSSPHQNHLHNSTNYSNSTFRSNGLRSEQPQISNSSRAMDRKLEMTICSLGDKESAVQNEHREDDISLYSLSRNNSPGFNCTEEKAKPLGRIDITSRNNKASVDRMGESTEEKTRPLGRIDITSSNNKAGADKMGESSIISDILSLDFDPWDDSLSSANTFVRLLGEKKEQDRSFTLSNSWKSLTSNQSRFSFARQQSQTSLLESPVREINHVQKFCHSSQDSFQDSFQNVLQFNDSEDPYVITSGNNSSDRTTSVPRAKITAPPGFSAPSRAPPPGFSCQDRFNQEYETAYSGGNHYQSHLAGNSGDVEFIDPAILAIGKGQIHLGADNSTSGLTTSFPAQFSTSDSDPRLHLMAQQSVSSHQNMRTQDHMGERFLPLNDAHIASQLMAQSHTSISPLAQLSLQQLRNPLFSNNQWNAWNSIRTSNDRVMGEIFRSERFGLANYYTSNGENKLYIPSAGDLYNRAFGM